MHKLAYFCLCFLLVFVIVGSLTPETNAPISGTNFFEEVSQLPFHPRSVDVDSKGSIFVLSYDQDVWRSNDNGVSWTKVLDDGADWTNARSVVTRNWLTLHVDSQDNIFANIFSGVGKEWNLYRSTDGGNSWSVSLVTKRSWHMDEAPNGTLWFHTYIGPGWDAIYKSVDNGATWSVFYNFTMVSEDLRTVAVNDYNADEIWAATSKRVMYWNGSSWITVHYDNISQSYISSIWFDPKYVYLGAEFLGGTKANWRYHHAPTPGPVQDYDYYWDAGKLAFVPDEHSFRGLRIDDIMLFGIRSQLWASWDGNRWVKIVDLGNSAASDIESISQRRPIYFVDKKVGKLYRLSVAKEDLITLYYSEFLKYRGNIINQDNYSVEYRISNGTNDVDLTNVALKDIQVSVKGLSRENYFINSGFETGTTDGWILSGQGVYSVDSSVTYDGTHSLRITKSVYDTFGRTLWQNSIRAPQGAILVLSAWVKANTTLTNKLILGFRNETGGTWANYPGAATGVKYFNVTTSWSRIKLYLAINGPDTNLRAEFHALKDATYDLFVDGLHLEKREVEIIRQEPEVNTESIEHLQYQPSPYFDGTLETENPSLIIAGQNVSYSGTLTNGTESSAASLSGILAGAVKVDTNIHGSGQAILRLAGTRVLSVTNSVLKEPTNEGIYVGRYYSIPAISLDTNYFIALTNKEANIINQTCVLNKLSLTIDSARGTTSTTLIYVGGKGMPNSVSGPNVTWTYNSSTKIVTVNMMHISPQDVALYWTEHNPPTTAINLRGVQGSNYWFTSDVAVALTATDDTSGVDKTEYSFDNSTWITYTTFFTVSNEGNTIIYYKSTDKDGNVETVKTQIIEIDKTTPIGSIKINNVDAYTTSTSVILALTASDNTSGVAQMRFKTSNNPIWLPWEAYSTSKAWGFQGDGEKTIFAEFMDNAGLVSPAYRYSVTLDTMKPIANAGNDKTVSENTLVTFDASASRDENGIATYTWAFTDVAPQTLTGRNPAYTFVAPGTYTITLEVTDLAGNTATDSLNVIVHSKGASPLSAVPFPMWVIGTTIAAVGIATAALLWKKRKRA